MCCFEDCLHFPQNTILRPAPTIHRTSILWFCSCFSELRISRLNTSARPYKPKPSEKRCKVRHAFLFRVCSLKPVLRSALFQRDPNTSSLAMYYKIRMPSRIAVLVLGSGTPPMAHSVFEAAHDAPYEDCDVNRARRGLKACQQTGHRRRWRYVSVPKCGQCHQAEIDELGRGFVCRG